MNFFLGACFTALAFLFGGLVWRGWRVHGGGGRLWRDGLSLVIISLVLLIDFVAQVGAMRDGWDYWGLVVPTTFLFTVSGAAVAVLCLLVGSRLRPIRSQE